MFVFSRFQIWNDDKNDDSFAPLFGRNRQPISGKKVREGVKKNRLLSEHVQYDEHEKEMKIVFLVNKKNEKSSSYWTCSIRVYLSNLRSE